MLKLSTLKIQLTKVGFTSHKWFNSLIAVVEEERGCVMHSFVLCS